MSRIQPNARESAAGRAKELLGRSRTWFNNVAETEVDFSEVAPLAGGDAATRRPVLASARAAGHTRRAVLEIIGEDPEQEVPDSARRLAALGWADLGGPAPGVQRS